MIGHAVEMAKKRNKNMRRPANDMEKKAGYLLLNWRHALQKVNLAFARQTMDAFNEAAEKLVIKEQKAFDQQFSESRNNMFDACKAPGSVGIAHNLARLVLREADVKTITNADFEEVAETFDYSELGQYGADIVEEGGEWYLKIPIGGGGCR